MAISRVKLKKPKIVNKDLKNEGVWGFAYQEDFFIEIEKDQSPKNYLNTLIHEMIHCFLPDLSEKGVSRMADLISDEIWKRRKQFFARRNKSK